MIVERLFLKLLKTGVLIACFDTWKIFFFLQRIYLYNSKVIHCPIKKNPLKLKK